MKDHQRRFIGEKKESLNLREAVTSKKEEPPKRNRTAARKGEMGHQVPLSYEEKKAT